MPQDAATAPEEPEAVEIDAPELVEAVNHFRRWKTFKSELAELAKMDSPTVQLRMAYAQSLVIELLQEECMASGIIKPLFDIYMAMHEVSLGGHPAVLFEAKQPDGVVTKPTITFTHYVQGLLAATYAALVNPDALKNPRQDGVKPAEARKLLDPMLRERNLGEVSGTTLQAWYYQVDSGSAAPKVIEAFESWKPVLAKLRNATEAKAWAAEGLDVIADLQLRSLKLRHPPPAS
jgi:hypothetical protein